MAAKKKKSDPKPKPNPTAGNSKSPGASNPVSRRKLGEGSASAWFKVGNGVRVGKTLRSPDGAEDVPKSVLKQFGFNPTDMRKTVGPKNTRYEAVVRETLKNGSSVETSRKTVVVPTSRVDAARRRTAKPKRK